MIRIALPFINAEEAPVLEDFLLTQPDDLETRLKLIAYFGGNRYSDQNAATNYYRHLNWLVTLHPEHPDLRLPWCDVDRFLDTDFIPEIRDLYDLALAQHPDSASLHANIAFFYSRQDPAQAEIHFLKSCALDPDDHDLLFRLAFFYFLTDRPQDALNHYQKLFELFPDECVNGYLYAGEAAVSCQQLDFALHCADKLEQFGQDYHHPLYHVSILRGKVALQRGQIHDAIQYLKEAADKESKACSRFSLTPDLELAQDLLDLGHRQDVIAYLSSCAAFWPEATGILAHLKDSIEEAQLDAEMIDAPE